MVENDKQNNSKKQNLMCLLLESQSFVLIMYVYVDIYT